MTTQRRHIFAGIVIVACLISSAYAIRNEVQGTGDHDLTGTNWQLQSYGEPGNLQSPNTSTPTLEFRTAKKEEFKSIFEQVNSIFRDRTSIVPRDTNIGGTVECNYIFGNFKALGSQLEITVYGISQVSCTWSEKDGTIIIPNLSEMTYVDLLNEVQTYTRDDETLTLATPDEVLVFQRIN